MIMEMKNMRDKLIGIFKKIKRIFSGFFIVLKKVRISHFKKVMFYLSRYGVKTLFQVIKKSIKNNYIPPESCSIPVLYTDMLPYQSHIPYRLDQPLKGRFNFPLDEFNRIDVLTANYKMNTSGIKMTLLSRNKEIIREIVVSGDLVQDCEYTKFEFLPIAASADEEYEFIFEGIGELNAAVWINENICFNEVTLEKNVSINCKLYTAKKYENLYQMYIDKYEPKSKELDKQKKNVFKIAPKISIIVPTFNTPKQFLVDMIESVTNQTYTNWELCLADGGSINEEVREIITGYAKHNESIKYTFLQKNLGIVGNTNKAAELATGDYIALLDHDDTLAPYALFEGVKVINENDNVDFIYSDEDKMTEDGTLRFDPHFKPNWSPDTLRSYNYITHFTTMSMSLFNSVGRFIEGYDGSQDYDLILRATEQANKIVHIPKVLYHWRASANSTSDNPTAKMYAFDSAKKALGSHMARIGVKGKVEDGLFLSSYKLTYKYDNYPMVSIVIPNKDHSEDLRRCIDSITNKTDYKNYEIIIVENGSSNKETFDLYKSYETYANIRITKYDKSFSFYAINNYAVQQARGEMLLFLASDTQVINRDWMERMLEHAVRKEVGAVGAKLYYTDNTIQHAGLITGGLGIVKYSQRYFSRDSFGYFGRLAIVQNLSAVTANCIMVRKDVFNEVGGFGEENDTILNDVDFCMKIRKSSYLIVWTNYAELYHYEPKSMEQEDTNEKRARFKGDVDSFYQKWGYMLKDTDPYYNPNLSADRADFSLKI